MSIKINFNVLLNTMNIIHIVLSNNAFYYLFLVPTTAKPSQLIVIGNSEQQSTVSLPVLKSTLFLLTGLVVPQDGTLVGFSAYFLTLQQVEFQIWRPNTKSVSNLNEKRFALIFRFQYNPTSVRQVITVCKYFRVR